MPIWSIGRILDFLDASQAAICRDISSTRGKGLVLLRLCNEILRRLSKSQDSTLSGRLLLFLSKVFPSAERSGVNLRGDINVENLTEVADWDDHPGEAELHALFTSFWGLQHYIYHPVQSLMTERWGSIKGILEDTLGALERVKIIQDSQEVSEFFPKFLANRRLFPLQLNDPSWRAVFLIQCSIYLQHLLAYSHKEEHKPPCAKSLSAGLLTEDQVHQLARDSVSRCLIWPLRNSGSRSVRRRCSCSCAGSTMANSWSPRSSGSFVASATGYACPIHALLRPLLTIWSRWSGKPIHVPRLSEHPTRRLSCRRPARRAPFPRYCPRTASHAAHFSRPATTRLMGTTWGAPS